MWCIDGILDHPKSYEHFSWLFSDIDAKKPGAIYFYIVFFMRRFIFSLGIILFYNSPEPQICICLFWSWSVLLYFMNVMPYQAKILNIYSIFNEFWVLTCSVCLAFFEFNKIDTDETPVTSSDINLGWFIISVGKL